jgi:hypothetical protein
MSRALPVLNRHQPDTTLFASAVALAAIGLVMVYSASSVVAHDRLADSRILAPGGVDGVAARSGWPRHPLWRLRLTARCSCWSR